MPEGEKMLDHVSLTVTDYSKSRSFYEKALEPLGYRLLMEFDGNVGGFGLGEKPDFWIGQGKPAAAPVHIAFASEARETGDAFHSAAMAAGGHDNGAPSVRAHYHPYYY